MSSSHKLVIKDAVRQLFGRLISALFGFVITKIIASYLGPLRYGDYGTIFRYFARRTALVDFGIYVIAVKQLGALKEQAEPTSLTNSPPLAGQKDESNSSPSLNETYHKFLGIRTFLIISVYTLAIITAYLIPAYTDNQFIVRGLPFAMMYSASNMFVGIQQLPLQLFRKMNKLSWSLIIARFSQLAVLLPTVYWLFKDTDFETAEPASPTLVIAFCMVVFSVVASSIGQNVEIHHRSKSLLPFKIDIDFSFIKNLFKKNRKYGFSYFFSSFHTLIVLMFLGRFFPTSEGFKYVGFRALALSLIEILLIIPSSLGNSLLHKIPNYQLDHKKKSFGNLLTIVVRIGIIVAINFCVFDTQIIQIVSSSDFLGSRISLSHRGANQILPFLGIVLVLSFIKQCYNYLFVATDEQNILFKNNVTGVILGVLLGLIVIPKRNLLGGVITQIFIECIYTFGAIRIAHRRNLSPTLPKRPFRILISILIIACGLGLGINYYLSGKETNLITFFAFALIFNSLIAFVSFKPVKQVAKGLTID
ncbi:MAG: polysaccharide biosynthesis C-terminal domain-containing protein [Candidatus Peribacteria bacterium]|jgi:O-antigen/teichoic acid export membrane protein|nr:polysaccharide biosynthesis C-terminal domain-containing protein [Candidatus Peribacteria bacterium]